MGPRYFRDEIPLTPEKSHVKPLLPMKETGITKLIESDLQVTENYPP